MAYSIDATEDGCYPGTHVLMNKLDIRDQKQLEENETLITTVQSLKFELSPFPEEVDFSYYKRLHRFLFDSLYFRQLVRRAGYHLNFAAVDSDKMMLATIHAASGVTDTL